MNVGLLAGGFPKGKHCWAFARRSFLTVIRCRHPQGFAAQSHGVQPLPSRQLADAGPPFCACCPWRDRRRMGGSVNVRFTPVSSTGRRNTPRWSAPTVGAGAISPIRAKTLDTALVSWSGSGVIRQYWQLFRPSQRFAFSGGMNRVRACLSICMPFQRGGLE
jgi:hypothetical protein